MGYSEGNKSQVATVIPDLAERERERESRLRMLITTTFSAVPPECRRTTPNFVRTTLDGENKSVKTGG